MGLRRASAYTKKYARPYTRKSAVKRKNYIKAIPPQKIVKLRMGDIKGFNAGKFKFFVTLSAGEALQIRDLALEASRQYVHKVLEESCPGQYFLELKVYPHHIVREHRVAAGAGADRMAIGMAHSFGITIGRSAFVKNKQPIFLAAVSNDKSMRTAILALSQIKSKLPCHCLISVEQKK
jgi:large subunit ribosomal protein L10e